MVSLDYEVYVMARFKFKVYLENKIKNKKIRNNTLY